MSKSPIIKPGDLAADVSKELGPALAGLFSAIARAVPQFTPSLMSGGEIVIKGRDGGEISLKFSPHPGPSGIILPSKGLT